MSDMLPIIRASGAGTIWRSRAGDIAVVTGGSLNGSADPMLDTRGLNLVHFFHLTHATNPGDPWSMEFEHFMEEFVQLHPHEVKSALRELSPLKGTVT